MAKRTDLQKIAISFKKRLSLSTMSRPFKLQAFEALVEGLATCEDYNPDDLYGIDMALNQCIKDHEKKAAIKWETPKLITTNEH